MDHVRTVRFEIPFDHEEYSRALQRVRAEYLEMPGMQLTPHQVQRLAGVNALICARVLDELVTAGVLQRAASGTFGRAGEVVAAAARRRA